MGEINLPITKTGLAYIDNFDEVIPDFLNDFPLYYHPNTGQFYQFINDTGIFLLLEENDVRRLIYQYLQDCWNPKLENSILASLPVYAKVIKEFNDVKDIIVCKNGVFCLDNLQLKKFSSKYHSTFRLEAPYNPDANASTYDKFLKDISCNDAVLVDTFNELLGYVLCSSIQAEKLIIMNGFGANGKSTYLNLLTAFVGVDNVSNISINEINGKAFSRHFIADKRLNLIYEGETDMVMSGLMRGAVKQIVTGDPTSAEIKMGRNYSFIPKLKLVMSTNMFPKIDKIPDHATVRRLLILPFNNHFSADKADKDMLNKLLTEQSGILNRAIEGLIRLKKNSWKFSYEEKSQQLLQDMICTEFPIFEFAKERIVANENERLYYNELRQEFKRWCNKNGLTPILSDNEFAASLKQSLNKLNIPFELAKGGGDRGLAGITFK